MLEASTGKTGRVCFLRAESPIHEGAEAQVEPVHDRHHDDDKPEHDARVTKQLTTGRGDNFLQFIDDLAQEQSKTRERATPVGALLSGVGDDILTGFVDHFPCHTHNLSDSIAHTLSFNTVWNNLQGGQDLNLQPAVLETAALPIEPPPFEPSPHQTPPR
jgi:hypothetical protein